MTVSSYTGGINELLPGLPGSREPSKFDAWNTCSKGDDCDGTVRNGGGWTLELVASWPVLPCNFSETQFQKRWTEFQIMTPTVVF